MKRSTVDMEVNENGTNSSGMYGCVWMLCTFQVYINNCSSWNNKPRIELLAGQCADNCMKDDECGSQSKELTACLSNDMMRRIEK